MDWMPNIFRRHNLYKDLAEEMRLHLEERTEQFIREGMSRAQAEQAARRAFGNSTLLEETSREVWQWPTLESIWADVRYALRQLSKSPGFAVTVILTMALGIGANTAIFTLVHAILIKSLPVSDPKSLYRIGDKDDCCLTDGLQNDNGDFDLFSYTLYQHLRDSTPEFEQLAAIQAGQNQISVRRGSNAAQIEPSEFVSGNYFSTFGVGAFAGRALTEEDDKAGAAPAVVMSYQAWQSDYVGDPSVVGGTFYLQSQPVTVVGIAPSGFFGDRINASPPAFWIPLNAEPLLRRESSILRQPYQSWLYALGRIRPGVAVGPLQQKISASLRQWLLTQDFYTHDGGAQKIPKLHVVLTPGGAGIQNLQQETGRKLYLLLLISALVLLVACANVANLLLARGTKRRRETSMRMALGAARTRLIRQMLTESLLLGCLGGVAGLAVACAGTRIILALAFPDSPGSVIHATPSLPVLGFALLLSLITGIVFGIVPAWITSHGDPADALRGVNRSAGDRASLPQKSLIIFQAALSMVLLTGAGLLTRSLGKMEHQDFGLRTTNRYVVHLDPASAGYKPEKLQALNLELERQFAAIPGVETVGLALFSPLDGHPSGFTVFVPGKPAAGQFDDNEALIDRVSPQFFDAVGQPILRGRSFTQDDSATSPFVTVVNQAFVKKFFPGEDPIGRRFGSYDKEDVGAYEIVGIVADAKYTHPRDPAEPMFFRPLSQWQHNLMDPTAVSVETQSHFINSIILSFHGQPRDLDKTVRHTLASVDPNLTVVDLHSLDDQMTGNFNQERLVGRMTTLFGLLTLVLASVGLYGLTSYQVNQRTKEIGVRMALGARRSSVLLLVMRGGLLLVALGIAVGVPVALLGARLIADQLYGLKSYDPFSLSVSVVVLLAAAVIAVCIPARRAASIEPTRAIRVE
jgi:predicted permease